MHLYSAEELNELPEFQELDEALRNPDEVFRFRAYRIDDPVRLAAVVEFPHLLAFDVSLSDVSELLPRIDTLSRLQKLSLQACKIKAIPDAVTNLTKLERLHLHVNELRTIPDQIDALESLQILGVSSNQLSHLPETVCRLNRLRLLTVECNPFESLPSCLTEMSNLETLHIEAENRPLFMDWSYQCSDQEPRKELQELDLFVSPRGDRYKCLLSAVSDCGLSSYLPIILLTARCAISVETTKLEDQPALGSSRLGGFPDLPDPSLFPQTDGKYWSFLAQISLADASDLNNFLPDSGLLSFFLESTETMNAQVLFYQGDPQVLATAVYGRGRELADPYDDYTANPHRVSFAPFASVPFDPPREIKCDEELVEAYECLTDYRSESEHHINGYTFTQQESPQQQAADALRGRSEEWVPLLKLGWDADVGFCFWDAGTLTFCIHQEDLRRWDFSKVHVSLESS